MKRFIVLFFLGISHINFYGQNLVQGFVVSEENTPLPFVHVLLTTPNDSVQIEYGTVTDMQGAYHFTKVKNGDYNLVISMIGYKLYKQFFSIDGTDTVLRKITLNTDATEIKEVSVVGKKVSHFSEKTEYIITPIDRKKASSGLNLLEVIPKVHIDNLNNKVTSAQGGNFIILINGLSANESDLLSIKPNEIIKITYYKISTGRFAASGASSVIDVTTRNSIEGFSSMISLQNAILTGFGNDLISCKYNYKKSQFGLKYYLNYRDYTKYVRNDYLAYTFNGIEYKKDKVGIESPMFYADNNLLFDYIFKGTKDFTFRVNFIPTIYKSNNTIMQKVYSYQPLPYTGSNKTSQEYSYFRPKLDLYLQKKFKSDNELIFNMVGNYFDVSYNSLRIEKSMDNDTLVFNELNTKSEKYSLISEIAYSKQYDKGKLSSGIKYTTSKSNQINKNTLDYGNTSIDFDESYGYLEFSGDIKFFSYLLSSGISYNNFNEHQNKNTYNFLTFRPLISLDFEINDNNGFNIKYLNKPIIPTLSQLSATRYYIDDNLVYSGNPELKPYVSNIASFEYYFTKDRFESYIGFDYDYAKKPILTEYLVDEEYILQMNNNQNMEQKALIWTDLTYYPFKSKWLKINLYGEYYKSENKIINSGKNQFFGYQYFASISGTYKKWLATYQYQGSYDVLQSQSVLTNAPYSYFSISHNSKDITVGAGIFYAFQDSWNASSKTLNDVIVKQSDNVAIFDNGNMLVFTIKYNFSLGRSFNVKEKQINNNDTDTGVLQIN